MLDGSAKYCRFRKVVSRMKTVSLDSRTKKRRSLLATENGEVLPDTTGKERRSIYAEYITRRSPSQCHLDFA